MSSDFVRFCRAKVIWEGREIMNRAKFAIPSEEIKIRATKRVYIKPFCAVTCITLKAENGVIQIESINKKYNSLHWTVKILRIVTRRGPVSRSPLGMNLF